MVNYKTQGKKNREAGQRFELKVRADLEKKGWIVDRFTKNVELDEILGDDGISVEDNKLITAKPKTLFINGRRVIINMWTGFPDFIAFRTRILSNINSKEMPNNLYEVIGIESKSNGYLTKEEKEKVLWLIKNNIFSKILVAKKGDKRGEIEYDEIK